MEDRAGNSRTTTTEVTSKSLFHQTMKDRIDNRKRNLTQIIMSKRLSLSSNQKQIHQKMDTEEDKEELMNLEKDKLQMNQYKMKWRKKKEKDVGTAIPGATLKVNVLLSGVSTVAKKATLKRDACN